VADAIICEACGAKVRATRERCPRCRALLASAPAPKPASETPKWGARAAIGAAAAVVLVGGAFALTRGTPVTTAAPAVAAPAAARPTEPVSPAVPTRVGTGSEVPFLEAPAAGVAAYKAGDLDAALAQFREAIERNPEDAESLSNLGQVLVKMGKADEAIPFFERAAGLVPERWAYRFNLARAQGLLGRWDDAISSYKQAQQLFPDDYVTTFNLARAFAVKGEHAAAADEYKKAIELEPNDPSFRMALALTYERLQKPAEAAAAYEEALRLAPSAPDADTVRARIAQLTGGAAPAAAPSLPPAPR
jgi:tetratricopeptide (TPR) repeat protein